VNDINHSGDSMIVDPMGEILYHQNGKEDIFTTSLEMETLSQIRAKLPFLKDADDFNILP
jgi:predicted amidohydrolase